MLTRKVDHKSLESLSTYLQSMYYTALLMYCIHFEWAGHFTCRDETIHANVSLYLFGFPSVSLVKHTLALSENCFSDLLVHLEMQDLSHSECFWSLGLREGWSPLSFNCHSACQSSPFMSASEYCPHYRSFLYFLYFLSCSSLIQINGSLYVNSFGLFPKLNMAPSTSFKFFLP